MKIILSFFRNPVKYKIKKLESGAELVGSFYEDMHIVVISKVF